MSDAPDETTFDIHYEVTDLFCGEANYAWVKRGLINCGKGEVYSDLAVIRRVKKAIGWSGRRTRKEYQGGDDCIALYLPSQVCFITFHPRGS